jgi:hypothetical protein
VGAAFHGFLSNIVQPTGATSCHRYQRRQGLARSAAAARNSGMAAGAVVDHVIHDDADAACVCLLHQFVEVGERAEGGFDVPVILDRVAVVVVAAAVTGISHRPCTPSERR